MNWEDALGKLIELVQTAAPKLWEIARRQVGVQAIGHTVGGMIPFILAVFFGIMAVSAYKKSKDETASRVYRDNRQGACFGFTVGTVFALIVSFGLLFAAFSRFYNPDYYAIQILVDMVK